MPTTVWICYIDPLAAPREYHGIYIHIGEGSYFKVGGGRDLKSKYIKCKRRDGDVQSRGGENLPTLQRGGGGGGRPLPSLPTPMIHRPTYIHRYVNTLLSVILLHFPRTSEPESEPFSLSLPSLCLPFFHSHPSQCPQPNALCTHTGSPSRASPSGFPLEGFRSPSLASRDA